ncbi:MAG: hypothetical protein KBF83_11935, partial [Pyrinomonadaceae bacterium]|nr:hypothetical protein [Pyrinomonadaceae bacterium]
MSKRIRDIRSPVTEWRKWLAEMAAKPFARLSERQRFWFGFAFLCIVTTFLIHNPFWRGGSDQAYKEGDVARESIISPADIYFVDPEESERLKNEAKEAIKPIFRFESNKADHAVQG